MAEPETASINMADIYRFLAQSMRYPDASWFDDDYCSLFLTLLEELDRHDDAERLRPLLSAGAERLAPLQVEYTRLFINAVPHVVAPPYGSVYLSSDGTLYGRSTEQTKQFYRDRGFELTSESEIPDHLVCELDFLALLAEQNRADDEKVFLKTLFRPWFAIFSRKVVEESREPFYTCIIQLIDFFTENEA